METKLKMIYWKGEKFWVGKLLERPDIMTQGETLEELEENMKEAFLMMTSEDGSSVGENLTLKKSACSEIKFSQYPIFAPSKVKKLCYERRM